jgi:hypothetical protein
MKLKNEAHPRVAKVSQRGWACPVNCKLTNNNTSMVNCIKPAQQM